MIKCLWFSLALFIGPNVFATDTDGDGYPDNWNEDQSASDSTSNPELVLDAFPNDASRWSETGASPVFNWNPHGDEFRINTYTGGPQDEARVAGLSGGGFVAIWQGKGSSDSYGIYGQRYLADGTTIGNEFRINTHTSTDRKYLGDVAGLRGGGFISTWSTEIQDGSSGVYSLSSLGQLARLLDLNFKSTLIQT